MIRHIVLMRRNDTASDQEIANSFAAGLAKVRRIDGVANLSFQATMPSERHPYTHVLLADLRDEEALRLYRPHPLHRQMAEQARAVMAEFLVVDVDLRS